MALSETTGEINMIGPGLAPFDLTGAGDFLYFVTCSTREPEKAVQRIPKAGGAPESVAEGYCPTAIAADERDVCFIEPFGEDQLRCVPTSGGEVRVVAPVATAFALDDEAIYFADESGLHRVSRVGGPSEQLAPGPVTDIAVDSDCVYWADEMRQAVYALGK
jgi:hypothetical protein